VGSTVRSQQSRDRQGALRRPNLQILLQKLMATRPGAAFRFTDLCAGITKPEELY
jgi:hypothetical protein